MKCVRGKEGANQIDENLRVPERSYACNHTTYKVSRAKLVLVKKEERQMDVPPSQTAFLPCTIRMGSLWIISIALRG